ncbi:hypothetical protein MPSEU_000421500 [Mayamaea pseudoterrestris]|nr:hypothetical protein MPSEU_000421500 [Mayamaea pseudoterrestris]
MTKHFAIVCFLSFLLLATVIDAAKVDVYEVSIVGNAAPGTKCATLGANLGPQVMETFQNLASWLSDYNARRRRHLKEPKSKTHRQLQVKVCTKTYCSKPQNYDYCYFSGCKCSCGRGRMLAPKELNGGDVQVARKAMEQLVKTSAAMVPDCTLEMVMTELDSDELGL